jgi:cell division protein FtsN
MLWQTKPEPKCTKQHYLAKAELYFAVQAGSYSVVYTAEDVAGNVATATRVVKVVSPCTGVEHFCSATCRYHACHSGLRQTC